MSEVVPLRRLLTTALISLAILLLLGYAAFEARRLVEGPELTVEMPRDGSAVGGPTITISGTAHNVSFLNINGKQAYIDGRDHFEETLSPPSGYTVITVSGTDRFGRTAAKSVHLTLISYCRATSTESTAGA